jgi:hypothetical protein
LVTKQSLFAPEGCEWADGVGFEVVLPDEDIEHVTFEADPGEPPPFFVIRIGDTIVFTEDPSTAPEGCEPRDNPISVEAENEVEAAIFVNICGEVGGATPTPKPVPTPTPGVTPPETDLDLASGGSSSGSVPLVLLGLALGTAGLLLLSPMPRRVRRRDED